MEKKNVQTVNDEELKATTGGDCPLRGCGSAIDKKICERHSDCFWEESQQKCKFKPIK